MKPLFLYFAFSFLFIFYIDAATPYSKGYVVNTKNDTVYGLLRVGNNSFNAQKCVLKDSINHNEQVYTPDDISCYRFSNGKYYVSKSLTANDSTKKVFMEYLVKGIVDIYYYSDISEGRYFVDKGDGILVELKNTKYTVVIDEKTYLRFKTEYITILSQMFLESTKTCEELLRSELDYNSLTKLVVDYHKDMCTSEKCIVYAKKTNPEKLHFGVLLGLNSLSTTKGIIDDREEGFQNLLLGSIIYPSVGIFFEIKFPYINNDLFFAHYEASFYQEILSGTSKIKIDYSTITYEVKDTKFNFKNTLLVKYDLSRGKLRSFVETGLFAKFALTSRFELTKSMQYTKSNHIYSSNFDGTSPFLNTEVGPVAGVGLKYKITDKWDAFIDFRYNWGTGVVSDNHFKTNLFSLNLGIQLF